MDISRCTNIHIFLGQIKTNANLQQSLKDIFQAFYTPLCNYASSIVHDKHASEDIVQTIFIQLWEKDKILSLDNPGPYLFRCVKYKSIDYLRSPKLKKEVSVDRLPEIGSTETSSITESDIIPIMDINRKVIRKNLIYLLV